MQFSLDGSDVGSPVELDSNGQATWMTSSLTVGEHRVAASYTPTAGSVFLASSSPDESHTVTEAERPPGNLLWLLGLLILIVLIILLLIRLRR